MNQAAKIKLPPHSKEAEMMVLGCGLTSIDSLNVAASSLEEQDFYFSEHKIIFSVLEAAFRTDKPADLLLVSEELKRQDKLETVGGVSYLTTLAQYAGTSAYIEEYVSLIKNKSLLRRMIQASEMIEKGALDNPDDVDNLLDDAQKMFFQIGQASGSKVGVLISDVLMGAETRSNMPFLKELEARQERYAEKGPGELAITGLPTHFIDLDKIINGLNNSHLIILAARPAMGKTALALDIAEAVCFKNNSPVGIFSLEMTSEQLVGRIISAQSEVEAEKIRSGALNAEEFQRVASAVSEMKEHVMIIDDTPGLKITDLRARARRMKESYNISLLIIDYLQLLSGSGSFKSIENRQNEISEISRMLKNLARELDIPILCIAQLSRKVEERTGHKPLMSDLRESGSIEQDADIIMLLLRRDYYDPNDRPGQAQLFVAKNRHGAIGDIYLTYRKEIAQFANYIPIMRAGASQEFASQEVPTSF
jgi:replicative DNA helicase